MGVDQGTSIYGFKNNTWSKIARFHVKNCSQIFDCDFMVKLTSYELIQIRNDTCENPSKLLFAAEKNQTINYALENIIVQLVTDKNLINEHVDFSKADIYHYFDEKKEIGDCYQMWVFKSDLITKLEIRYIALLNGFYIGIVWSSGMDENRYYRRDDTDILLRLKHLNI